MIIIVLILIKNFGYSVVILTKNSELNVAILIKNSQFKRCIGNSVRI